MWKDRQLVPFLQPVSFRETERSRVHLRWRVLTRRQAPVCISSIFQLKTSKSSRLMFTAFYERPITSRYLCPSPSASSIAAIVRWKQMDVSISNSHLGAFQKRSRTIQKSLNQTRNLAAAAQLLNITLALGKLFMPLQGEIQSSMTSEDTLQVSVNTP